MQSVDPAGFPFATPQFSIKAETRKEEGRIYNRKQTKKRKEGGREMLAHERREIIARKQTKTCSIYIYIVCTPMEGLREESQRFPMGTL
jgi:hypothetical protein